ncbi:MAG: hypothetical protein ABIJ56_08790 [Pseudomonadota bacterium]
MNRRSHIIAFWGILAAGAAAHVVFWLSKEGMHYPDEIFQYIEPAFVRINGFGWLPWEFNRGVRNWSLIAVYGGWMKMFMAFGAEGYWLHKLIGLHNTLLALAIVPAALRIGRHFAGETGGWTAAALAALFPPIIYFTPHPLSEVPSMVLSTWGLVMWLEGRGTDREKKFAFLAGMLLGFSVVARFFSGVLLIVPAIDYLARLFKKNRGFAWFVLGGLVPLAVLAISDWLTWGIPLHSAIEYFRYNILEWGNADHGTSPWWMYFSWMLERLNWGLIVFLPFFVIGTWRTRLLTAANALALVALTFISHKEERFLLGLWPLFIITFSVGVGQVAEWMRGRRLPAIVMASACGIALMTAGSFGVKTLEWHWLRGYFEAQDFVGRQNDASGCMFSGRLHLSGGAVYINRNIPMDSYQLKLSRNPLFNYFIFKDNSSDARMARSRKWEELEKFDDIVVFRKQDKPVPGSTSPINWKQKGPALKK